jgi:hypothetical protein
MASWISRAVSGAAADGSLWGFYGAAAAPVARLGEVAAALVACNSPVLFFNFVKANTDREGEASRKHAWLMGFRRMEAPRHPGK